MIIIIINYHNYHHDHNYYRGKVEQIAFSPAHLVPGIEPSPDKMLQVPVANHHHGNY